MSLGPLGPKSSAGSIYFILSYMFQIFAFFVGDIPKFVDSQTCYMLDDFAQYPQILLSFAMTFSALLFCSFSLRWLRHIVILTVPILCGL